jgi:hypothetical protein
MRLRRMRFTIRRMMVVVAVAGLIFGCLAWLLPSLELHFHDAYIQVGPYVLWSTSPAFWAILLLVLALFVGLLVGFLAVIVCAAKAISRRIIDKA